MAQGDNLPARHVRNIQRTYYVDAASGSDATSEATARDNPSSPWATIQKAIDTFAFPASGDVAIRVRKTGVYQASDAGGVQGTVVISGKGTSSTQWLIVMADNPAQRPVVRISSGSTAAQHDAFQIGSGQRYVIIDGFEIDSVGRPGPTSGSNDGTGVYVAGPASGASSSNIELWNLWIHHLQLAPNATGGKVQGIFSERRGNDADAMLVINCKVHDIGALVEGEAQNDLEHGMYVHGAIWVINTLIYNVWNGFCFQVYDGGDVIDGVRTIHCTFTLSTDKPVVTVNPRNSTNISFRNSILRGTQGSKNIENLSGTAPSAGGTGSIDRVINKPFSGSSPIDNAADFTITNHIVDKDPGFHAPGADFHIWAYSPAKGYVDNTYSLPFDLDNMPRPSGSEDAGCYQATERGFSPRGRARHGGQPWGT